MNNSSPQVIIVAGPNGAGKSTVACDLLEGVLEVDHFVNADRIAAGLAEFAPENEALRAGRIMLKRIEEFTKNRESFAFESTLAGRTIAGRLKGLLAAGYAVRINYLWLDNPDLAVKRVKGRAASGGHDIPETDIRRRYWRSIRNFDQVYGPQATSWRLYNSSSSPTPSLVALRREGEEITICQQDVWKQYQACLKTALTRDEERNNDLQR